MKKLLAILILMACAVVASAATNPFLGTWTDVGSGVQMVFTPTTVTIASTAPCAYHFELPKDGEQAGSATIKGVEMMYIALDKDNLILFWEDSGKFGKLALVRNTK